MVMEIVPFFFVPDKKRRKIAWEWERIGRMGREGNKWGNGVKLWVCFIERGKERKRGREERVGNDDRKGVLEGGPWKMEGVFH